VLVISTVASLLKTRGALAPAEPANGLG